MQDKDFLRKKAKEIRRNKDIEQESKEILSHFICHEVFLKAKNILAFHPKEREINIKPLFELEEKNWFLPKVIDNEGMRFCKYKIGDELIKSSFGVMEPVSEIIEHYEIDLVITPALMVDKRGVRLGYGGGYYDKFFSNKNCLKVSFLLDELFVEELPNEDWDVSIDYVFTTERIIKLPLD